MVEKCSQCNKLVNKKTPGIECNKCKIIVHSKCECSGLTIKQLSALNAADNLEWTCLDCSSKIGRKTSLITPEDEEEDEDEEVVAVEVKKFMKDITKEMDKVLKRELKRELNEVSSSVQFMSEKLDDCMEKLEVFQQKIRTLEQKNVELVNKNIFLENRISAIEQRMNEAEQFKMINIIEVAEVPVQDDENVQALATKIASKLNVQVQNVKNAKRLNSRAGRPGAIHLEMQNEEVKTSWLAAARAIDIKAGDLISKLGQEHRNGKIFIREALTPFHKNLLWKSKQALKDIYKYVWCRYGKVMARKQDNDKVIIIRSENDLQKMAYKAK